MIASSEEESNRAVHVQKKTQRVTKRNRESKSGPLIAVISHLKAIV